MPESSHQPSVNSDDKITLKRSKNPLKSRVIGWMIATLMKTLGSTWRMEWVDEAGMLDRLREGKNAFSPHWIWVFWHNRISVIPLVYWRLMRHTGLKTAVLTSPSGDGSILEETVRNFNRNDSIRGSSSKKGAKAMIQMVKAIQKMDLVVTPDGPRGPRYEIQPGVVKLAQMSGAPVMPIQVEISNAWQLKTWDGLYIPKPFSRIKVTFSALRQIPRQIDESTFETHRLDLEKHLRDFVGEDIVNAGVRKQKRSSSS